MKNIELHTVKIGRKVREVKVTDSKLRLDFVDKILELVASKVPEYRTPQPKQGPLLTMIDVDETNGWNACRQAMLDKLGLKE